MRRAAVTCNYAPQITNYNCRNYGEADAAQLEYAATRYRFLGILVSRSGQFPGTLL